MTIDNYATSQGVESAIKEAAKKAASSDPSLSVSKRITLEYFNRFLSRIFSERDETRWILKGGTGLLARVPSTRETRDIDLAIRDSNLAQALTDLIRLSQIDLGDHFRFLYAGHTDIVANDMQFSAQGYRVKFNMFIGLKQRGQLQIDLVVDGGLTGEATILEPASALPLPRLVSHPYRLYPVVDHIADKVCATLTEFNLRASTREKDLVDLVVFAATHEIEGQGLRRAITTEAKRRTLILPEAFRVPSSWRSGYEKLAAVVPYCADYPSIDNAVGLVSQFIDPVLENVVDDKLWNHNILEWV